MDRTRAEELRELFRSTGWVDRSRQFGSALRRSRVGRTPGGLLVVGTPQDEPWHLTAHLRDEAEWASAPELTPTLVRWSAPVDAPPHLAVDVRRLEKAQRGESLLVVAPTAPTDALLNRVDDARLRGAAVFAMSAVSDELSTLADDALVVDATAPAPLSFDVMSHLVSLAAGESKPRRGPRVRLAALLDSISGPAER